MGFEKYKVPLSAFDLYYDKFLQNSFRGKKYKVTLKSGDSLVGTPMVGSMANPSDPNVSFSFTGENGVTYRIPFREIDLADEIASG
ncbi:MAG: hypothetical protein ACMG6S_35380 [Byssovorax sp.]